MKKIATYYLWLNFNTLSYALPSEFLKIAILISHLIVFNAKSFELSKQLTAHVAIQINTYKITYVDVFIRVTIISPVAYNERQLKNPVNAGTCRKLSRERRVQAKQNIDVVVPALAAGQLLERLLDCMSHSRHFKMHADSPYSSVT